MKLVERGIGEQEGGWQRGEHRWRERDRGEEAK